MLTAHNQSEVNFARYGASRHLVIITGYYGFDNLGDEAILEELLHELTNICNKEDIVVLSNNPEKTKALHGVKSINRWHGLEYISLLKHARWLISGGGGLFQDRTSFFSVPYYAAQIFLARLFGAKVLIYAQGLGPLQTSLGRKLTQIAMRQAQSITLRDDKSITMLESWHLTGTLSSDPVWMLKPSPLPESLTTALTNLKAMSTNKVIGLSLRNDPNLQDYHLEFLAEAIAQKFSACTILLLPFQPTQDSIPLQKINDHLLKYGLQTHIIDSNLLTKPSQWLALIQSFDLVIGMRLHALLMAIQVGKPVIGIAYDPKVSILLNDFQQPLLPLSQEAREDVKREWFNIITNANVDRLSELAKEKLAHIKKQSAKNNQQLIDALEG